MSKSDERDEEGQNICHCVCRNTTVFKIKYWIFFE